VVLAFVSTGFAQEADPEVVEVAMDRPMYERFGMTSTELFALMMGFTIVLIFVLVGMAHSLKNIATMKLKKGAKDATKMVLLLIGLFTGSNLFAGQEPFEQKSMDIPFPDEA